MRALILIFAVASFVASAHADILSPKALSNSKLVAMCRSKDATAAGLCTGYIFGFLDTMELQHPEKCMPEGVTIGDFQNLYLALMDRAPELLYSPPVVSLETLYKKSAKDCL